MKRDEATACLKEILNSCDNVNPDAFLLMEFTPDAAGYAIYIKAILDDDGRAQVHRIITNRHLVMREDRGGIVIYKQKMGEQYLY